MSFLKVNKPQWSDGVTGVVEPVQGKKDIGWLPQEKPPAQFMNWIHYVTYQWLNFFESHLDKTDSMFMRSDSQLSWNGTTGDLTFPDNIELIFKSGGSVFNNRILIAGSPINLSDGDVVVAILSESNIDLALDSYGSISDGKYSIVSEASVQENSSYHEVILFRRRGSVLEIPFSNQFVRDGYSFYLSNTPINASDIVSGILGVQYGGTGTGTQFTQGSVVFAGAAGVYSQDNVNFFWDNSLKRLGIGTNSPQQQLHVAGAIINGGFDFILGNTDQISRGNSGASRALVKETGAVLVINYNGDFTKIYFTNLAGAPTINNSGLFEYEGLQASLPSSQRAVLCRNNAISSRAYVIAAGDIGAILISAFNIGSVVRINVGTRRYTLNFITSLNNSVFSVLATADSIGGSGDGDGAARMFANVYSKGTTFYDIRIKEESGGNNWGSFSCATFGGLT